ncbi:MAG TPA: type I secretion system permease/ATPase [Gammaproteobacteria bacterium]|nr:type I secretion system permease/ATPase [Gammaproteobacteria bacterium]
MTNNSPTSRELNQTLDACKQYFIYAGVFSAAVNILMLTPIIYMLTVYDRVVASGSLSTLAMLTILMVFLLMAVGGFEWVRSMILISASSRIENLLRKRVSDATFKRSLLSGGIVTNAQPLADLAALRQFLTGNGLFAFFDAPWFPIYIGVMFMFHPWFGVAGILSGIVMVGLAYANETSTNSLLKEANLESNKASNRFQGSLRNAEVVAAMGMSADITRRQDVLFDSVLNKQVAASKKAGMLSGLSKSFRLIVQSLLLGLGAYLTLNQQISPGMMIAGSLLLGRALAPIDMLVGTWKGFSLARAQYARLQELLENIPADSNTMSLPAPQGALKVEQVSVAPPSSQALVVRGVTFELAPGEALGMVGPSASGKSTLARALMGIWPSHTGKVRIDGADISAWNREELGPHLGYLPQDIELFDGTIADNISRFSDAEPGTIVAAAKLAGVHEMILHLPKGYDTVMGGAGGMLSGGQRQRIGLARAVFGNPKLLVLDEPNSNLDDRGEKELVEALRRIKSQGCTIVVITHRTMVLQCVDKILVMKEGAAVSFGPKDQVLSSLMAPADIPKSAAN